MLRLSWNLTNEIIKQYLLQRVWELVMNFMRVKFYINEVWIKKIDI